LDLGIKIKKESDNLYSAEVFDLPPFLSWVKPQWTTPAPMSTDELIRELRARGFHQIDIADAFCEADPDWLKRSE
jgi:hypothetical protein